MSYNITNYSLPGTEQQYLCSHDQKNGLAEHMIGRYNFKEKNANIGIVMLHWKYTNSRNHSCFFFLNLPKIYSRGFIYQQCVWGCEHHVSRTSGCIKTCESVRKFTNIVQRMVSFHAQILCLVLNNCPSVQTDWWAQLTFGHGKYPADSFSLILQFVFLAVEGIVGGEEHVKKAQRTVSVWQVKNDRRHVSFISNEQLGSLCCAEQQGQKQWHFTQINSWPTHSTAERRVMARQLQQDRQQTRLTIGQQDVWWGESKQRLQG